MMDLSPRAAKAKRESDARINAQIANADRGPRLETGWDQMPGQTIVIPSPARHPEFNRVLRAYGFHFEVYATGAVWIRSTATPYKGKTFTPQGWLQWGITMYSKAWPNWQAPE